MDFTIHKFMETRNGKRGATPKSDYTLTLDMAKELAMVERNEQGRKIRKYMVKSTRHNRKEIKNSSIEPIDTIHLKD